MTTIYDYFISYCLLLLFIILIKLLFKKKMPSSLYKILWLVGMLRLTIPIGINLNIVHPTIQRMPLATSVLETSQTRLLDTSAVLLLLYAIGAVVTFTKFYLDYRKVDFIAKSSLPLTTGIEKIWVETLGVNKKTEIRYSDEILQPFAYGVLKPKIILPQALLTEADPIGMEYIITHEMTHIKHHDVFIKRWSTILCALHWFNPLVWLMDRLLAEDIEKSCDEVVIERFGLSKRQEYAELLLVNAIKGIDMTGQASLVSSPVTERIKTIMTLNKPQRALGVYIVTIVTAVIFLISLLGYSQESVADVTNEQPSVVEEISVIDSVPVTEEPVEADESAVVEVGDVDPGFPTLKRENDIDNMSVEETKAYLKAYSEELTAYLQHIADN